MKRRLSNAPCCPSQRTLGGAPQWAFATRLAGLVLTILSASTAAAHDVGSLTVSIGPAAVAVAGAQWSVADQSYPSDTIATDLNVGTYRVSFSSMPGWIKPDDIIVSIAARALTTAAAQYAPETESPVVVQHPQNVSVKFGDRVTLSVSATGRDLVYQWYFNGVQVRDATNVTLLIPAIGKANEGSYYVRISNVGGTVFSNSASVLVHEEGLPVIITHPANVAVTQGQSATLTVAASSNLPSLFKWQRNGSDVAGATNSALTINNVQPADTGLYATVASNADGTVTSNPAILGVSTTDKVIGTGTEVGTDIHHPNGNIFDQVLLEGAVATITANPGQVTRMSYIDLTNDIVQVEFSGAGTLSLVLDNPSGPATPANYNQASVNYMKGHAGIVITGANEGTNVSVFTVGRATAFDPTDGFNILLPISLANNPANNGSSLFQGHTSTVYDGVADIAFIAISSADGKFGGLRSSNGSYFATKGYTGIYAPGVEFSGPVFVGEISAFDVATPVLLIGSSPDTRVTGGDLFQSNGQPVKVSGITQLKFTAGSTSHGGNLPAQTNQAILQQNGSDVTSQIVINPTP